jgi:hypothetical protein
MTSTPLDRKGLRVRGWVSCTFPESFEHGFRERLFDVASQLGNTVLTRPEGSLCDLLTPTHRSSARARSLSRIHSIGEFPLHIDTAHWQVPCRYIILGCLSPGGGHRKTLLLDTRRVPLNCEQISLLRSAPLRVTNGRASFFSTILATHRRFVRYESRVYEASHARQRSCPSCFFR